MLLCAKQELHQTQVRCAAGVEKVTGALAARRMKCGGTPEQRAERLFQSRGKQLHELPAKLFQKGCVPKAALDEASRAKRLHIATQTANVEAKAAAVVESLGAVIEDTQAWVEKKLSQNYDELKQDIEREDFDAGPEDSDDEVCKPELCASQSYVQARAHHVHPLLQFCLLLPAHAPAALLSAFASTCPCTHPPASPCIPDGVSACQRDHLAEARL
jgi:Replication stress response SDE2 C-terminal